MGSVVHRWKFLFALLVIVAALFIFFFAARGQQELRRKAAVPGGPANIVLSPGSSTIPAGASTIELVASIAGLSVDGFQIVAKFTGGVPSDIGFVPTLPSGLGVARNEFSSIADGKELKLAFITIDPSAPFTLTGPIALGKFQFTAPSSGTMDITFDLTLSKITQNKTTTDLLAYPSTYSYNFGASTTGTPTPTVTPPAENHRPKATKKSLPDGKVGTSYDAKKPFVEAADQDRDTMTMTLTGLPVGLSMGNCTTTVQKDKSQIHCVITGTPTTKGKYAVKITVVDQFGALDTDQAQITIK